MTASTSGEDTRRARRFVDIRLGRPPQDELEAAVVLEAWGGVQAPTSIELGRGVAAATSTGPTVAPVSRPAPAALSRAAPGEVAALLLAVLALALYMEPLSRAIGTDAMGTAWNLALPVTFCLQWALQRRYPGRRAELALMRPALPGLVPVGVALVALPAFVLGDGGAIGGLLVLAWTGGALIARRGWGIPYSAALLASTVALAAGVDVVPLFVALVVVTTVVVLAGIATLPGVQSDVGSWGHVVEGGVVGAGLGCLLVLDTSMRWNTGIAPLVAFLPSAIGALWGGIHLSRLWVAIPEAVWDVPVGAGDRQGMQGAPVGVFVGAVLRLVAVTVSLSALVALFTWSVGEPLGNTVGILCRFLLFGLATLVVIFLDAFGRQGWALVAVLVAVAVQVAASALIEWPPGTGSMLAGSLVAIGVALPAAVRLLQRPGRALATALLIP